MAASVQFRPHNRDLGMVVREVDENLAIFLGMRNAEKQANDALRVEQSDEFDNSTGNVVMADGVLISNVDQIAADDEILKLETGRSDFDWLLAADTSLLPSVEFGGQEPEATQVDFSNGNKVPLESETPACDKSATVSNTSSEPAKSTSVESTSKRPSSSGNRKPVSRSGTPTRRSSLPAKPKASSSSAPSSRNSLPSSKPTAAKSRSSTPAKATSRSSTPSRPSVPASSTSKTRSATPTHKPAVAPSNQPAMVRKTGTSVLKVPVVKSRPSKPLETLSVSLDGTPSLKVSIPKRPVSASRGRPSGPTTNLSSKNGKPRQKSCSPARVRAPASTAHKSGSTVLPKSRVYANVGDDDVNPVLMGTQMVERVVNMRKLAPPKQDECLSQDNPKKSSKPSGFGRSLSSRSLDMAVRHMDIRRSMVADGIRPVSIGVSSSSSSSGIRSSSAKSGTVAAAESPVASSSDGSEFSSGYNTRFGDENEMDGSTNIKC